MASITVMCWNIENLGSKKYKVGQPGSNELIKLIAAVIMQNKASIVGLLEIRDNNGSTIVNQLKSELDNKAGARGRWNGQWSKQLVPGRQEQYVFVWDQAKVTTYNSFQVEFSNPLREVYDDAKKKARISPIQTPDQRGDAAVKEYVLSFEGGADHSTAESKASKTTRTSHVRTPNRPPRLLGFPKQEHSTGGDRPPYLGYFQTVPTPTSSRVVKIPIAIFHAPGPGAAPPRSCNQLAYVKEFYSGDTCLIMGDFNIDTTGYTSPSNPPGFGNLVHHHFSPQLNTVKSSLKISKSTVTYEDDCYAHAYDNAFFRTNTAGISTLNGKINKLIAECLSGSYLENYLKDLENKKVTPATRTGYSLVEDAFPVFRTYVSDHMPAVIEVQF